MKVTEHNISNWELDEYEIDELIRLTKEKMNEESTDRVHQTYYGIIVGKLLIMKNSKD